MLRSVQGNGLGAGLDEVIAAIDAEMAKPIPGSTRVTESVVEDEMAIFARAAAQGR